jgi:hypothetical protein
MESCRALDNFFRLKTTKEVVLRQWGITDATKDKENPDALARFLARWQHVETFTFQYASVLPTLALCIERGLCTDFKSIKIEVPDKKADLKGYDGGYDAKCLHRTYLLTRAMRRQDLPLLERLEASFNFSGGFYCVEVIVKALSSRICPKLASLSLSPMPDSQVKGADALAGMFEARAEAGFPDIFDDLLSPEWWAKGNPKAHQRIMKFVLPRMKSLGTALNILPVHTVGVLQDLQEPLPKLENIYVKYPYQGPTHVMFLTLVRSIREQKLPSIKVLSLRGPTHGITKGNHLRDLLEALTGDNGDRSAGAGVCRLKTLILKNTHLREEDVSAIASCVRNGGMPDLEHLSLDWQPTSGENGNGALTLSTLLDSLRLHGGALKLLEVERKALPGVEDAITLLSFLEDETFLPELKVEIRFQAGPTRHILPPGFMQRLEIALRKRGQVKHPYFGF